MRNVCCRVRFLSGLPYRQHRDMYLEYWRSKDGQKSNVSEVEAEYSKLWAETKAKNRAKTEMLRAGLTKTG